jgi:hypothetical protein
MNRLPQRRAGAITNATEPERQDDSDGILEPASPGKPRRIALGWRLAIVVWVCGFVGIFGYELWGMLVSVVKKMF